MPDRVTLQIDIEVPTPEVTGEQLELADQVLNGDPAADMAFDVLQQSVVDALTDAGVAMPSDVEPECFRTQLKIQVGLAEDELSPVDWLTKGYQDDADDADDATQA